MLLGIAEMCQLVDATVTQINKDFLSPVTPPLILRLKE